MEVHQLQVLSQFQVHSGVHFLTLSENVVPYKERSMYPTVHDGEVAAMCGCLFICCSNYMVVSWIKLPTFDSMKCLNDSNYLRVKGCPSTVF